VATSKGIEIFDVVDPGAIVRIGIYSIPQAVYTLDLDGTTLYAAATTDGVHVLDVSDPTAPRLLSRFRTGTLVDTVKVRDGRAFVSGAYGPAIFDMTYPEFPVPLASFNSSYDSQGMNVRGQLIFCAPRE
jgi:hypothetical protein